jgi:hypothetical protein
LDKRALIGQEMRNISKIANLFDHVLEDEISSPSLKDDTINRNPVSA